LEIKNERESLLDQLENASEDLHKRSGEMEGLRLKNEELQLQLTNSLQTAHESANEFEKRRQGLLQELEDVRVQLKNTDGAAYDRLNDLNAHLEVNHVHYYKPPLQNR
jgi:predicted  nucleic acid-binding Zn-ribbon protein